MDRPYVTLAFAAALLGVPSLAAAQSNTLVIEQLGSENSLSVDQSDASNSSVGGLALLLPSNVRAPLQLYAPGLVSDAARQVGSGNAASITIDGVGEVNGPGGNVVLLQRNIVGTVGNEATVMLNAAELGVAGVVQFGADNVSSINVTGELSSAATVQVGSLNDATVNVIGDGSFGAVTQIGTNNVTGLDVIGDNLTATYTQFGSGLRSIGGQPGTTGVDLTSGSTTPGGSVQVISNATNVSITQTGFGSGR